MREHGQYRPFYPVPALFPREFSREPSHRAVFGAVAPQERQNVPEQCVGRGEEIVAEVERGGGARAADAAAALAGDVSETLENIGTAAEDDCLDSGAQRGLRGPGIIAAIEQCAGE